MKRKLFNAALFATVVVAAPVGTFVSCADYDSDIENLQGQTADLKALVLQKEEALQSKIAALEAKDKALEEAYKAADEALKAQMQSAMEENKADCLAAIAECKAECAAQRELLQQQIDEIKGRLAAAETSLAAAEGNIAKLFEADSELQKGIDAANSAIEALSKRVDGIDERLKAVEGDVAGLKTTVSELKDDLAKVRQEFAAADEALKNEIQGKIDALWAQVNANKADIAAEKTARENAIAELAALIGSGSITGPNGAPVTVTEAVNELQSKDAELASQIAALNTDFENYKNLTDAEIVALKAQIAAVEGQVSANTGAILDLTVRVLDLYQGLEDLAEALEAVMVLQEATAAAQDALDLRVLSLEYDHVGWQDVNNIYEYIGNLNDALAGDIAANKAEIATVKASVEALKSELETAKAGITSLRTDLNDAIEAYKAADAAIYTKIGEEVTALNGKLAEYAKKLSAEVKGFVLVPDNYYQSIQAIEGRKYVYNAWNVSNFDAVQTTNAVEFCPEVVANYNINPSTAQLSTDATKYAYTVEDRIIRGVNNSLQPVVKSVAQANGVLTVKMSITDPASNATGTVDTESGKQMVSVMALQYTNPAAVAEDNQVVTSDYAALYLSKYDEVYLLDKDQTTATTLVHLADGFHTWRPSESAAEEVIKPKLVDVAYNNAEGYKIADHILTRFGWSADNLTPANLPEGFSYRYTFNEAEAAGVFNVTEDGVVTAVEKIGNIGKSAKLRVDVMNGDKVAEVGYLEFKVKGAAVKEVAEGVAATAPYALACYDAATEAFNVEIDPANVWEAIVNKTGLTEAEAKDKYHFVVEAGAVKQYSQTEPPSPAIGTITYDEDKDKLNWVATYNDLAGLGLLPTEEGFALVTSVLVQSDEEVYSAGEHNEFYLPIAWVPSKVEVWGAGNEGVQTAHWNYTRVPEQWQATRTQDYELRLYADLTQAGTAPYNYDIPAKAFSGTPTVKLSGEDYFANYNDFALTNGHYVFVDNPNEDARVATGVSGKTYSLTVSPDGSQLLAVNYDEEFMTPTVTPIVEISNEGVISLNNNPVTKDILNAYEKDELGMGQTLAAYVSYAVECCAGTVQVAEGFNVRFLKPVTVADVEYIAPDAEGAAGVVTIDLAESIVCFTGYNFKEQPSYFTTFGLSMALDMDNWTTNYNGGELGTTLLSGTSIASCFDVDETDPAHPLVKYTNNTSVINEFKVRIPLTITHVWGSETKNVDVVIGRTIGGNSNKRK